MIQQKFYWLSQGVGWFLYILANLSIVLIFNPNSNFLSLFLNICFLSFCGLLLSHQYRNYIHKNNWLNLSPIQLIPRTLIASLFLSIVILILSIVFGKLISANEKPLPTASTSEVWATLLQFIFNIGAVFFLWSVLYFAIHFFINYKQKEIEALKKETILKDLEINILKSQINPHFIFNALNSIRALISENPSQAQSTINQLSNILRTLFQLNSKTFISLEQELKTINDYLAIEEIRYEERLDIELDIHPETLSIQIPPMLILTLVENAIKHGIAKNINGGRLKIKTFVQNNNLCIQIYNPGNYSLQLPQNQNTKGGYGLINTHQRLKLLYPQSASLTIENEDDNTVLTQLIIPKN